MDTFGIRAETCDLIGLAPLVLKVKRSALNPIYGSPVQTILKTFSLGVVEPQPGQMVLQATVTPRKDRIRSSLSWIVRGLHYHHRNTRISPSTNFDVWAYNGVENKREYDLVWPSKDFIGPFHVGGCLHYKAMLVDSVPEFSFWLLYFYDSVFFKVVVGEDELRRAHEQLKQESQGNDPAAPGMPGGGMGDMDF